MVSEILHNEKQLLTRLSQGNEEAFREIFNFYRPRLYTAALQMTGDTETAQDIYQELFLKVWLKRSELPEIENFPGWLYTVTKNLIFDALKRSNKNKAAILDLFKETTTETNEDPEQTLRNKELQTVLTRAIDGLSPRQKQAYQLIRVEGLSRIKTAEIMNISPETVKTTLQAALRNIRVYCMENLDFIPAIILMTLIL